MGTKIIRYGLNNPAYNEKEKRKTTTKKKERKTVGKNVVNKKKNYIYVL